MWSLYLFVNKLLKLEEDVRNRSEEDGSDLAESCSFQISAVCALNHDELLPRSRFIKVPHVNQLYDWDCGLACILMVCQTIGISGYDLPTLERICSTRSIWTVDLAYLLQKFSISFSYFTVTLGANPDFSMETFYKDQLPNDLDRVDMLFRKALESGIKIECRSVSREEICFLILSGKYIAVVLVDQYKLSQPWLEGSCIPGIYDSCLGYTGKLFTWGDGDNGQLGHGDKEARFIPECVASIDDLSFSGVACGRDFTLGLTISGRVYAMGSSKYGQLGSPEADGMIPLRVEGKIASCFIEEVACGSHHAAVLTSKAEVYTWGMGTNGQLGNGDTDHRKEPTLVDFFKDKQVKSVACGSNFTAVICLHKWMTSVDHSACTTCHNPFNFRRKRHNCYNCGLVFCKACNSRKSLKASLAPNMTKPYRVCDDCFSKLKKNVDPGQSLKIPRPASRNNIQKSSESSLEKETSGSNFQIGRTPLQTFVCRSKEKRRWKFKV